LNHLTEENSTPERDKVKVLGDTFEPGKPERENDGHWRQKLSTRAEELKYLETGERYWYSRDWPGSEKRKTPA
jgi:hypothetical protein